MLNFQGIAKHYLFANSALEYGLRRVLRQTSGVTWVNALNARQKLTALEKPHEAEITSSLSSPRDINCIAC